MRKKAAVAALRMQRAATLQALRVLPEPSWEAACPGFERVRDLVGHLVAVDEACSTGRILPALRDAGHAWSFEDWNRASAERWAEHPPEELLDALQRSGERLTRVVARLPSVVAQLPVPGQVGRPPLLFLAYRRVLDEWLHGSDLARSTGAAGEAVRSDGSEPVAADPVVMEALCAAVLDGLPHLVLPRTERTNGVVRLVVETGGDARRTWGVDFARRQYGPRVTARPDAVVRTDACTLALLAEGREQLARTRADRLAIEGDEQVAEDLLGVLAPHL